MESPSITHASGPRPPAAGACAAGSPVLVGMGRVIELASGRPARLRESDERLALVQAGATKLVSGAAGDRQRVAGFQFAGDLVFVPAFAQHSYELIALAPSRLLVLREDEVLAGGLAPAGPGGLLCEQWLAALRHSLEATVLLGRRSAEERVAGFLVMMADRLGATGDPSGAIDLPMSRRDMAEWLGLTIETISRQIARLRRAGVIATPARSRVQVLDRPALASRAGHFPPPS